MKYYYILRNREWSTIDALEAVTLFFEPLDADVYIEQNKEEPYGRILYVVVNKPLTEYDIDCIKKCLYKTTDVIPNKAMTSKLYTVCKDSDKIQIRFGDEQYYYYLDKHVKWRNDNHITKPNYFENFVPNYRIVEVKTCTEMFVFNWQPVIHNSILVDDGNNWIVEKDGYFIKYNKSVTRMETCKYSRQDGLFYKFFNIFDDSFVKPIEAKYDMAYGYVLDDSSFKTCVLKLPCYKEYTIRYCYKNN